MRDLVLAFPALAVVAGLVQAAPPAGTLAPTLPRHCPVEMTLVGDTCVDRWEASLVETRPDGSEVAWSPYHTPFGHKVRAVSRPGVVPQGYASMMDAKRACEASHKRLCKTGEWRAACRGPQQTKYPYGDTHVAGACIDSGRTNALAKLYGGKAMFENKNMIDPRLNQTPNTVAKTGEATACTNASGGFDMVGNLHEWTDDGALRGGFYLDVTSLKEGCDYAISAHTAVYFDYATGFRCCADPTTGPVGGAKTPPPVTKKIARRGRG